MSRDDDREEARRVMKQVKARVRRPGELTPREWGLLYLYHPWLLSDVQESQDGGELQG